MWHVLIVYLALTFEARYFSLSQFGTKCYIEQNCEEYIFETVWESQTWNSYEIIRNYCYEW